ncbi:hypothetical protein [Marinibacterium profundimaris]|uniref:Uncharacterized protein n=1 Tax=Marinibacterium profundimaris TaxID=1679460 RepID=A0A225NS32_9RHOB|nr:hypothetical protein [Marinibacterium profundimaris]OWU77629.1 hypothetical protein ATO3_02820 [Marinibacterium profundimaris]
MQIILHTGAHFTEDDRLIKCLLRNKEDFSRRGVAVPGPTRYKKLLKDTLNAMRDTRPGPEARDVLMDAILDEEKARRMILSNAHFFGAPRAALRDGLLYPNAAEKVSQMRALFPDDDLEIFMAMRNPATLLPAIYKESPRDELDDFLEGADPRRIKWSESITAMRVLNPAIPITVWCNEDTPLIWGSIIRAMAGLPEGARITGSFDLLGAIISTEGMKRFRAYLKEHPVMSEAHKRRVMGIFLEKYALEEELIEELEMPGWTDELVEEMTEVYDADFAAVQGIPGVTVIAP